LEGVLVVVGEGVGGGWRECWWWWEGVLVVVGGSVGDGGKMKEKSFKGGYTISSFLPSF